MLHALPRLAARAGHLLETGAAPIFATTQPLTTVRLVAHTGLLLGGYLALEWWLRTISRLPLASYERPIILVELVQALASARGLSLGLVIALVLLLIVRARAVWVPWSAFTDWQPLRIIVATLTLLAAWTHATYSYNYFFDQSHAIDRLLLLVLAGLVVWRPIWTLPFVMQLLAIIWQFDYPMMYQYSWAEINVIWRGIALFVAVLLVGAWTGRRQGADYVLLLLCLLGANYWQSAWTKLTMGWLSFQQVHFLAFGGHSYGWLGWLAPETVVTLVQSLAVIDPLIVAVTLLVECGMLFVAWNRTVLRTLLVLAIGFHMGVVAVCGIFFWKWIVLEAVLLVIAWRWPTMLQRPERWRWLVSVVLIGLGMSWARPATLAWFDTRLSYAYHFTAIGQSGREYGLPAGAMGPYADQFTFGNFSYLTTRPQLTNSYAVTRELEMARAIQALRTADDVARLEATVSTSTYRADQAAELSLFLERYFQHRSAQPADRTWWWPIQAPRHLVSFPRPGEGDPGGDPVVRVRVELVTTLYDEQTIREIGRRTVADVAIPEATAGP